MTKLLNKYNIAVKFENLPKNILGFYIEVFDKPYIVLNEILHKEMHDFIFYACLWFKGKESAGKITMQDLEDKDSLPISYARKMSDKLVC